MRCEICEQETPGLRPLTDYQDRSEQYYRCPVCTTLYLAPLPARSENRFFEDPETARELAARDGQRGNYFSARLDWLEEAVEFHPGASRLLEIGCGSGEFLRIARQRLWQVEGVELSGELCAIARENNPDTLIRQGDFTQMHDLPSASFQAVVALDVLEHVRSPRELLLQCRRFLKKEGTLLLQTPNTGSLRHRIQKNGWNMLIPDYHFHLFNAVSLCRLLKETGFESTSLRTVSGSGCERGALRYVAWLKERLLSAFRLGNALFVLARIQK